MKQTLIIVLISILGAQIGFGQKTSSWTDFDTIQVYDDKVLVDYKSYYNSTMTEEGQAFLYPDSMDVRKSKWLPRFIRTSIPVDRMILHGIIETQGKEGKYRIGKYENGEKKEMTYFDSGGNEITYQDFYGNLRSQGDPEQGTNIYIIHGTKKRKK